eukprot:comp21977_c0_seq1/m.31749 comp21977_c0_seq1/g.31749  ORF comp21977_c0_seq1/g.31749 comp21977_c0_seq1/m.31749 type:complete len:461 (-) comp21977_c0_seq1:670-2052(-)
MGYKGPYSLQIRCLAEAVAMGMAMFIGLGVVANEVLPRTKGAGSLGFGWISFGFGLAFAIPIQMFGYMSIYMNPGTLIAAWINSWEDPAAVFCLMAAEFVGAFLGAVFMFLHHAPHFMTVPEPPCVNTEEALLRTRDAYKESAMQFISYNTEAPQEETDANAVPQARDSRLVRKTTSKAGSDVIEMQEKFKQKEVARLATRHSAGVAKLTGVSSGGGSDAARRRRSVHSDMGVPAVQVHGPSTDSIIPSDAVVNARGIDHMEKSAAVLLPPSSGLHTVGECSHLEEGSEEQQQQLASIEQEVDALYKAALVADNNAKLAVFATRPAIPNKLFNFIAEMQCTFMVVFASLMFAQRNTMVYDSDKILMTNAFAAIYEFILVAGLVVGLGGPTGIAANAARDFGPRLAHFFLPISNKGSSEFKYGLIPILANYVGGALAGLLFYGWEQLNRSAIASPLPCAPN